MDVSTVASEGRSNNNNKYINKLKKEETSERKIYSLCTAKKERDENAYRS
eukprot:gene2116-1292_t